MKKSMITLAIVLLLCVASAFAFTACKFDVESTSTVSADSAEDAKDLFDGFVSNVIECDDMVVTAKNDEGLYFVENVKGDKASIEYAYGSKAYAFVENGKKIAAQNEEGRLPYYITDNDEYDYVYKTVTSFFISVDEYLTQEGLTVSLTINGKENNDGQSATLSLTITEGSAVTAITIEQKDEKVTSFKNVFTDQDGSSTLELTFKYGGAQVAIPDLTDWFNASAPKTPSQWYVTGTINGKAVDEIPLYYDYISGCFNSDYVDIIVGDTIIVKNKDDATVSYTQNVHSDFLAGHECISFDANDQSVSFQTDCE